MKTSKLSIIAGASILSIGAIAGIAFSGQNIALGEAVGETYTYNLNLTTLASYLPSGDEENYEYYYTSFERKAVKGGTGTALISAHDIADASVLYYGVDMKNADSWIKNDTALIGWDSFQIDSDHPEKFRVYYSDIAAIDEHTPFISPSDDSVQHLDKTYSYFKITCTGNQDFNNIAFNYSCSDAKLKAPEKMIGDWIGDFPGTLSFYGYDLNTLLVDIGDADSPYVLDLDEIDGTSYKYLDDNGNKLALYVGYSETFVYKSGLKLGSKDFSSYSNQMSIHKNVASESVSIVKSGESVAQDEYDVYHDSSNSNLNSILLKAIVSPENSSYNDITWTIDYGDEYIELTEGGDNDEYATIKGVAEGEAMITAATADGKEDTVIINVLDPIYSTKVTIVNNDGSAISGKAMILDLDQEVQLKAKLDDNATETKLGAWTTDNSAVVSVTTGGKIKAKSSGTAHIGITYNKNGVTLSDSITVTVSGSSAVFHGGNWSGCDNNEVDFTWTVSADGINAVLSNENGDWNFTFDSANETEYKKPFIYDEDPEVIFSMVSTTKWSSSTYSVYLEIVDGEMVINDFEYFSCYDPDTGLTISK